MYQDYKPLRNFLRGFDLWSGLGCVYHYLQFIQFEHALPEQLKNDRLRLGKSPIDAGLFPHLVELLARELVLNAEHRGGKSFSTGLLAFEAMRMIHQLDDRLWGRHVSRSDDIMLQLSRIAFKQFPWQNRLSNSKLGRYRALYGHRLVEPMVKNVLGLSADELLQIVLLLTEEMLHRPTPAFLFMRGAEPSLQASVDALIERISLSSVELRAQTAERSQYDVNWAYSFNPLRAYPLVHAGSVHSLLCPAPALLIARLTDGISFDLMKADTQFGNAIGAAFEAYVGLAMTKIGGDRFALIKEARWGRPQRRSVDWIASDKSSCLFIECKVGRLDIASQTELCIDPPFVDAIKRIAEGIGQLYATLREALAGGYPHWSPDGKPIHPLLVTFHEWFFFGPFFYSHLDRIVDGEFKKRGLDPMLLTQYPFAVCSIEELEGITSACREHGIDRVMAMKNRPEHRFSLMRGFLGEHFPGSLHDAEAKMDDAMDAVVEAKTRVMG